MAFCIFKGVGVWSVIFIAVGFDWNGDVFRILFQVKNILLEICIDVILDSVISGKTKVIPAFLFRHCFLVNV